MKITYQNTILQRIINKHKVDPITFVYLNDDEYAQVRTEAVKNSRVENEGAIWMKVRDCSIVFYRES